jgi:hypothetical protein
VQGEQQSSAVLNYVQFINCTGLYSYFTIDTPLNWTIENVSFYNCSEYPIVFYISTSSPSISSIAFGGEIIFQPAVDALAPDTPHPAVFVVAGSLTPAGETFLVRSNPENPARWRFYNSTRTILALHSNSGHMTFEAGSIFMESTQPNFNSAVNLNAALDNYESIMTLQVNKDLVLRGLVGLNTGPFGGNKHINVGGQLRLYNNIIYSIYTSGPTYITAGDIFIENSYATALYLTSKLDLKVTRNFNIWCPTDFGQSPSIDLEDTEFNIEAGSTANFTNIRFSSSNGNTSITAETILFERCVTSGYGGAILCSDGGSVSINGTLGTLFKDNRAEYGGAIAIRPSSVLTLNGETTFESNIANYDGGAAFVYLEHMEALSRASFFSNVATAGEGCAVYTANSCAPFMTSGRTGRNLQLVNTTVMDCLYNSALCFTSNPPHLPPSPITPLVSCSGPQPSSGTWACINDQWTLIGSLVTETLTIPASTVVVVGNLTITGDLILTGLKSSVTVLEGCLSITGSLQIELTPEELEEISKEAGSSRTLALISQNSNCSSLTGVTINALKTSSSCRKIVSSTSSDISDGTRTTLSGVFEVNSFGCNVKWIILGCVLGGILVIVLVVILVVTFNDKAKSVVQPFWARERAKVSPGQL